MKRGIFGLVCVALLATPSVSNATLYLVDNGDGPVVVDTLGNRTWLADLSLSGSLTYSDAIAWVDSLNSSTYRGYGNWRLPFLGRYQDLWVNKMGNEMWNEPHRLPFLNVPDMGILWSNTLQTGGASCVGDVWGEWIPCVWAFHLQFNGLIYAHPNCYWESCIATAFHPGQEPITPSGLFAGLGLAVTGAISVGNLQNKVALAKAYYDAGDTAAACPILAAFNREAKAQASQRIAAYDAQWLVQEAQGLMDLIGCAGAASHARQCIPVQPVRDALAHWWPADATPADIVGESPGNLMGDASIGYGLVGGAFTFDGDGDFVEVPDDGLLDFGEQDFTVSLWVKFNSTDGEQVLIEKWVQTFDAPSTGWTLTKLSDGVVLLAMGAQGAYEEIGIGSEPIDIPLNVWLHLAVRREANEFSIFLNGERVATGAVDPTIPFDLRAESSLRIGHRGTSNDTPGSQQEDDGFFLNGRVDEVQIFTGRALPAGLIQDIYFADSVGMCKE